MTGTTAGSGRHARPEHRARSLVAALALAAGLAIAAGGVTAAVVTAGSTPATITAPAPHAHAGPPVAPVVTVPPRRPARAAYVTVRAGQCLFTIARAHGLPWRVLYRANRRTVGGNPGLIYPGMRLRLPVRK